MKATRREWLGLAVLCLPTLLVPVDISVLTQVNRSAAFAAPVIALMITYIGSGPTGITTNFLIMSSAPAEKGGAAGALSSTSGELGVALGVAVMGSVGAAVCRTEVTVPAGAADGAGDSIAGAVAAAQQLPGQAAPSCSRPPGTPSPRACTRSR